MFVYGEPVVRIPYLIRNTDSVWPSGQCIAIVFFFQFSNVPPFELLLNVLLKLAYNVCVCACSLLLCTETHFIRYKDCRAWIGY